MHSNEKPHMPQFVKDRVFRAAKSKARGVRVCNTPGPFSPSFRQQSTSPPSEGNHSTTRRSSRGRSSDCSNSWKVPDDPRFRFWQGDGSETSSSPPPYTYTSSPTQSSSERNDAGESLIITPEDSREKGMCLSFKGVQRGDAQAFNWASSASSQEEEEDLTLNRGISVEYPPNAKAIRVCREACTNSEFSTSMVAQIKEASPASTTNAKMTAAEDDVCPECVVDILSSSNSSFMYSSADESEPPCRMPPSSEVEESQGRLLSGALSILNLDVQMDEKLKAYDFVVGCVAPGDVPEEDTKFPWRKGDVSICGERCTIPEFPWKSLETIAAEIAEGEPGEESSDEDGCLMSARNLWEDHRDEDMTGALGTTPCDWGDECSLNLVADIPKWDAEQILMEKLEKLEVPYQGVFIAPPLGVSCATTLDNAPDGLFRVQFPWKVKFVNGSYFYRSRWLNGDPSQDTWEPELSFRVPESKRIFRRALRFLKLRYIFERTVLESRLAALRSGAPSELWAAAHPPPIKALARRRIRLLCDESKRGRREFLAATEGYFCLRRSELRIQRAMACPQPVTPDYFRPLSKLQVIEGLSLIRENPAVRPLLPSNLRSAKRESRRAPGRSPATQAKRIETGLSSGYERIPHPLDAALERRIPSLPEEMAYDSPSVIDKIWLPSWWSPQGDARTESVVEESEGGDWRHKHWALDVQLPIISTMSSWVPAGIIGHLTDSSSGSAIYKVRWRSDVTGTRPPSSFISHDIMSSLYPGILMEWQGKKSLREFVKAVPICVHLVLPQEALGPPECQKIMSQAEVAAAMKEVCALTPETNEERRPWDLPPDGCVPILLSQWWIHHESSGCNEVQLSLETSSRTMKFLQIIGPMGEVQEFVKFLFDAIAFYCSAYLTGSSRCKILVHLLIPRNLASAAGGERCIRQFLGTPEGMGSEEGATVHFVGPWEPPTRSGRSTLDGAPSPRFAKRQGQIDGGGSAKAMGARTTTESLIGSLGADRPALLSGEPRQISHVVSRACLLIALLILRLGKSIAAGDPHVPSHLWDFVKLNEANGFLDERLRKFTKDDQALSVEAKVLRILPQCVPPPLPAPERIIRQRAGVLRSWAKLCIIATSASQGGLHESKSQGPTEADSHWTDSCCRTFRTCRSHHTGRHLLMGVRRASSQLLCPLPPHLVSRGGAAFSEACQICAGVPSALFSGAPEGHGEFLETEVAFLAADEAEDSSDQSPSEASTSSSDESPLRTRTARRTARPVESRTPWRSQVPSEAVAPAELPWCLAIEDCCETRPKDGENVRFIWDSGERISS